MTALLSAPAAQAGSWTYVVTGDNAGSHFTDNGGTDVPPSYSPNTPITGTAGSSAGIYAYAINRGGNGSSGSGCDMTAVVNVQVTFTWHPDPSLPSDPPPDNVLVQESATAFWSANAGDTPHPGTPSGSATNGLGDTEYNPSTMQAAFSKNGYSGPQPDQSFPTPVPALVAHFKSYPASGGTVTVDKRTVTAHATDTVSNWYYGAKVSVSYSASIHAQQFNLRRANGLGPAPGTSVLVGAGDLLFQYIWDSTAGGLGPNGHHPDLAAIEIHENVDAPASPRITLTNGNLVYVPNDPPWVAYAPAHFDAVTVMADAIAMNDHFTWGTDTLANSFDRSKATGKYIADSYNLTQTYKFHDPATMAAGVQQIIPGDAGPFTIIEAVIADGNSPSGYSYQVTRDGVPSNPISLP